MFLITYDEAVAKVRKFNAAIDASKTDVEALLNCATACLTQANEIMKNAGTNLNYFLEARDKVANKLERVINETCGGILHSEC